MSTTTKPTRAEALAWMRRTGRSQNECVDELWGELDDTSRRRAHDQLRQWLSREKRAATAAPSQAREPEPVVDADELHAQVAAERIPFLEQRLSLLIEDQTKARLTNQIRLVPALQSRIDAVRQQLDEARAAQARQGEKLDRSVKAVCQAMLERQKLINALATAGEG
jgi:hypothetical protein